MPPPRQLDHHLTYAYALSLLDTSLPQDPGFKLKLKSGITMVSSNGVKVRVERDNEYATMKA